MSTSLPLTLCSTAAFVYRKVFTRDIEVLIKYDQWGYEKRSNDNRNSLLQKVSLCMYQNLILQLFRALMLVRLDGYSIRAIMPPINDLRVLHFDRAVVIKDICYTYDIDMLRYVMLCHPDAG